MPADPASLRIHRYPEPILRKKAAPIERITDETRAVAERMIQMMYDSEGIGLAAPQVGLSWRMFVVHVHEDENRSAASEPPSANLSPEVFINPILSNPTGPVEPYDEGCLSLPDIHGQVQRPPIITITATGLDGKQFTRTGSGLLARCWQHENDHLDGVLIIDRMMQMSRLKCRSAIRDLERDFEG